MKITTFQLTWFFCTNESSKTQAAKLAAELGLNTAMLASHITWVVAGITALVAAFVILWNKSETFRNFWIGLWEKMQLLPL